MQSQPLYDVLIKNGFKFTKNTPKGASYLMPDGSFLGMQENSNILNPVESTGIATHPDLDYWLLDNNFISIKDESNRVLCRTDNAIRLNDGTNFKYERAVISLPSTNISEKQYNTLLYWLYDIMIVSNTIDIGYDDDNCFESYCFTSSDHPDGYFPEDIIKLIKRKYNKL